MGLHEVQIVIGFIAIGCGALWFILRMTLSGYYPKERAHEIFKTQTACADSHQHTDEKMSDIKHRLDKIEKHLEEILKVVARYFGEERIRDGK